MGNETIGPLVLHSIELVEPASDSVVVREFESGRDVSNVVRLPLGPEHGAVEAGLAEIDNPLDWLEPLDLERLDAMAKAAGRSRADVAASLIAEVLHDDAAAHGEAPAS